jgi:hypothetical protein
MRPHESNRESSSCAALNARDATRVLLLDCLGTSDHDDHRLQGRSFTLQRGRTGEGRGDAHGR